MLPFLEIISDAEVRSRVEQLYYQHRQLLFNIANKRLQNEYLAEDAVQETFVVVAEKCETLDLSDDEQSKHLLTSIVRYRTLGISRKDSRAEKLKEKILLNETFEESSPEDEFIKNLSVETLKKALNSIDEKYSTLITLQAINGLKSKDIAELVGKSDGAVRQLLHTARKKIREIVEKEVKIYE